MSGHPSHGSKHQAHQILLGRLGQHAADVRRYTQGLEGATLERRAVEGKWSLKELVAHLRASQTIFGARVQAMLGSENPSVIPWEPAHEQEFTRLCALPAEEVVSGFLAERDALLARWSALTPEQWHRSGRHPELGAYDIHFQIEYMAHHEAHHMYQVFQRRIPLGRIPHG